MGTTTSLQVIERKLCFNSDILLKFFAGFSTRLFHRTDTYVGYYAGLLENIPIVAIYNLYFFIFVLFFIELCLYVEALIDDLKSIINIEMNSFVNSQIKFDSRKWRQFNSKFNASSKDFVLLHNDFCEYVHDVACFDLFSFFSILTSSITFSQLIYRHIAPFDFKIFSFFSPQIFEQYSNHNEWTTFFHAVQLHRVHRDRVSCTRWNISPTRLWHNFACYRKCFAHYDCHGVHSFVLFRKTNNSFLWDYWHGLCWSFVVQTHRCATKTSGFVHLPGE